MLSEADARAIRDMILLDDRDLMVLNKPFGLAVQGGSGTKVHLDGMLQSLANERGDRPVLVHRLDRDTSGVLLIAKTRKMAADLGEIFRSRSARKIYWAHGRGRAAPGAGPHFALSRQGRGDGGRRGENRRRAKARMAWRSAATSRRCASPNMATTTRSIR